MIFGRITAKNFQWQHIGGKLKWISSGKDVVFGVNSIDDIYYRAGMTSSAPTGSHWVKVPGKLAQIDTQGDYVWGVNSANNAFYLILDHCEGTKVVLHFSKSKLS